MSVSVYSTHYEGRGREGERERERNRGTQMTLYADRAGILTRFSAVQDLGAFAARWLAS